MKLEYLDEKTDLKEINNLIKESWKFAYKDFIPQIFFDSVEEDNWFPIANDNELKHLLAIEDNKIIGICSFGNSKNFRSYKFGEIIALYIHPDHLSRGIGGRLLNEAVFELIKEGFSDIVLWVFENNKRARDFYDFFGFKEVDYEKYSNYGGALLTQILLILKI